jgi:hypothetical protein
VKEAIEVGPWQLYWGRESKRRERERERGQGRKEMATGG